MPRALKVFRTAIGFHDAYVAAPSRKAALEAWGSDRNLFASGRAEIVTDTKLIQAPLARPGEVIKVKRGSAREHLAALPRTKPKPKASSVSESGPTIPRPSRKALDRAEAAIARAEKARDAALAGLAEERRRLDARRAAVERKHRQILSRLTERRVRQEQAFEDALAEWRDA